MVLTTVNAPIVAGYALIPAVCMLTASIVSTFVAIPPPRVVLALQHLAGGIILSAIAVEFVPVLVETKPGASPWEIPAVVFGFVAGAGMLIAIGGFMDEAENGSENEREAEGNSNEKGINEPSMTRDSPALTAKDNAATFDQIKQQMAQQSQGLKPISAGLQTGAAKSAAARLVSDGQNDSQSVDGESSYASRGSTALKMSGNLDRYKGEKDRSLSVAPYKDKGKQSTDRASRKKSRMRESMVQKAYKTVMDQRKFSTPLAASKPELKESLVQVQGPSKEIIVKVRRYPVTLAVAVALDALLDGLFIGLGFAAATASTAGNVYGGLVLSLSLAIEMTFLGLTFSVAVPKSTTFALKIFSVFLGPTILVGGTFLGASAGLALEAIPVPFKLLCAFGASALLYTVGEELLASAHGEDAVWWVDFSTVVGFVLTIAIDKLTKYAGA